MRLLSRRVTIPLSAVAALSAALLMCAVAPGVVAHPATHTGPLVAVGDSFLSGLGAGDYRVDRDGCRRSQRSAARVLAIRTQQLLVDLTCPNARVTGMPPGPLDVPSQVTGIPYDASVVLVSAGGNDVGFAALAGPCLIAGTRTCLAAVAGARGRMSGVVHALTDTLRTLRRLHPRALVVVLGYPPLVRDGALCRAWFGVDRLRGVLALQRDIDLGLARAAARSGAHFVDWPPEVGRHTLCDAEPWFVIGEAQLIDEVLHPTYPAVRSMGRHLHRALARAGWRSS